MRFMLLLKGDPPADAVPGDGELTPERAAAFQKVGEAMAKYSDELVKAGVLLAAEGLHPSAKGARVRVKDGRRTVVDGPFAEAKELVAGFYLIQVKDAAEATEWAKRCPVDVTLPPGQVAEIEVRQVFETEDAG
jgi:hypothetical protein